MSTQKSNAVVAVAAIFIAVIIIVFAIFNGKSTPPASPGESDITPQKQAHNDETTPSENKNQSESKATENAAQNIARIDQSTSLTPSATDSDRNKKSSPAANSPATGGAKSLTLMQAATTGNIAQLQQRIESGADIDAQDQSGKTALMAAASEGQLDAVFALLNAGANPALRDNSRRAARDYALARYDQVGKTIVRILEDATGPAPVSGPNDK